MAYYIANIAGDKYITRDKMGRISHVTTPTNAWKFDDRTKAENVMINNLNGHTSGMRIIEIPDKQPTLTNERECDHILPMVDSIELTADDDIEEDFINEPIDIDLSDTVALLTVLPVKIENEKKRLRYNLRTVSKALTDIAHYIELSKNGVLPKLNIKKRNDIGIFLEAAYVKRREIKDKLYRLNLIELRLNGEPIAENREYFTERHYNPRILNDLFTKHEIPQFEEWWGDKK